MASLKIMQGIGDLLEIAGGPLQLQAVLLNDYRPGDTAALEILCDKS